MVEEKERSQDTWIKRVMLAMSQRNLQDGDWYNRRQWELVTET